MELYACMSYMICVMNERTVVLVLLPGKGLLCRSKAEAIQDGGFRCDESEHVAGVQ